MEFRPCALPMHFWFALFSVLRALALWRRMLLLPRLAATVAVSRADRVAVVVAASEPTFLAPFDFTKYQLHLGASPRRGVFFVTKTPKPDGPAIAA